jgi:hypothetical protein
LQVSALGKIPLDTVLPSRKTCGCTPSDFRSEVEPMPSIYHVFDKSPIPVGSHLISGHVKKNNAKFDATKSYFTNKEGTEIDCDTAINLLIKAKQVASNLTKFKKDEEKKVSIPDPPQAITRIQADEGKLGFAVTWGDQVGVDRNAAVCKWVCLFVTKTLGSGLHQWVTAYPATESYVTQKIF